MKYLVLILCSLLPLSSRADVFKSTIFSLNSIYLDRDYDDNGVKTTDKQTDTDFRVMRVEKYWSYGLIYSLSSNDSSDAGRTSYGLSAGYYSQKDFYMNAHYFLSSQYKLGGGAEYLGGSGYEFDVGFLSKVTSSFYVGLLVAIKNFSYSEQNNGGVTSDVTVSHKEVVPMFTFAVNFM